MISQHTRVENGKVSEKRKKAENLEVNPTPRNHQTNHKHRRELVT